MECSTSPELYSAIAAAISALCALFTVYMYRAQGKGFVWTKDQIIQAMADEQGRLHIKIEIPLFNFGTGTVKFISLRAKKINLKTKAMENYTTEMDEAYFPGGTKIISYFTMTHSDLTNDEMDKFLITGGKSIVIPDIKEYQDKLNQRFNNVAENIIILKCTYKDGGWFGFRKRETTIGFSVTGTAISYLSTARRKELNEYFSW